MLLLVIIWKDGYAKKFWNLLSGYELSDTITKFVEIIKIETFGYSTYWSKSSTSVPGDKDLQHLHNFKKSLRNAHLICFMSPPSSLLRCKIDDLSSVSEVGECLIARMIYASLCKPFLINPLGRSSTFHQIWIVICKEVDCMYIIWWVVKV